MKEIENMISATFTGTMMRRSMNKMRVACASCSSIVSGSTHWMIFLRSHFCIMDDSIHNPARHLRLARLGQTLDRPVPPEQDNAVRIGRKAGVVRGNIVGHDQVEILALQFSAGVLQQTVRLRCEPDQHLAG